MIDYFLFDKNADDALVLSLLNKYNDYFIPRISERISISEYARKLSLNATIIVARKGVEDIGFCAFYFNTKPDSSYLALIAVNNNYQKFGTGSSLIQKMMDYCRLNNSSGIKLEMRAKNNELLNFYLKRGFIITDQFISQHNKEKKYYLYRKISNE